MIMVGDEWKMTNGKWQMTKDQRPTIWLSGSGGTGETHSHYRATVGKAVHTFSGGAAARLEPLLGSGVCVTIAEIAEVGKVYL